MDIPENHTRSLFLIQILLNMCLLKKHDAKCDFQENPKHAYAGEKRLTQPYSSLYFTQSFVSPI